MGAVEAMLLLLRLGERKEAVGVVPEVRFPVINFVLKSSIVHSYMSFEIPHLETQLYSIDEEAIAV